MDGEIELTVVATGFEQLGRKEPPAMPEEERRSLAAATHTEEEEESSVKWNIEDKYKELDCIDSQRVCTDLSDCLIGSTKTYGQLVYDRCEKKSPTEIHTIFGNRPQPYIQQGRHLENARYQKHRQEHEA